MEVQNIKLLKRDARNAAEKELNLKYGKINILKLIRYYLRLNMSNTFCTKYKIQKMYVLSIIA